MDIRPAAVADLPQLIQFDRHIPRERLTDCIHNGFVDVLTDGTQVLGLLRWSLFWQSIPFLDLLYLDEAIRGTGRGSKMMYRWEQEMTEKGFTAVLLSTQEDETAKFFYEKLGYTRCGSFLPPDQDVPELIYRKEL